jgi:hypothetical protein
MIYRNWRDWLQGFPGTSNSRTVTGLLSVLAVLGLLSDGWQTVHRLWHELRRPTAIYRRPLSQGTAISLNGLERQRQPGELLPGIDIHGVLFDRQENDWILFGQAAPERPRLPRDAVAIALRALRLYLDAPGIDIRPRRSDDGASQGMQVVSYSHGLSGNIVGQWFYRFDVWMKRLSLGYEPAPVPGLPIYWHRVVEELERESTTLNLTGPVRWTQRTRYWLCTGAFTAIEGDDTLTFEQTSLLVLAENLADTGDATQSPGAPCTSRGTDDPLAAEFAHWLTEHLHEVAHVVPVREIENFARLLAGLAWLLDQDPYRDVRPWLQVPLTPAETPTTVPTLARQAVRERTLHQNGGLVLYQYRREVSGGVVIAPVLQRSRVGDNSLRLLHRAVLTARPAGRPAVWSFLFLPRQPDS